MKPVLRTYVEYHCLGYDRSYSEVEDITGHTSKQALKALHEKLRARTGDEQVAFYKLFDVAEVTLDDGEVLRGKPKNIRHETYFGTLKQLKVGKEPKTLADVPANYLKGLADDDYRLNSAREAFNYYSGLMAKGYTHQVKNCVHAPKFVGPKDRDVRVFDAASGAKIWPKPSKPKAGL